MLLEADNGAKFLELIFFQQQSLEAAGRGW